MTIHDWRRAFVGTPDDGGEWPPRYGWIWIPIFVFGIFAVVWLVLWVLFTLVEALI